MHIATRLGLGIILLVLLVAVGCRDVVIGGSREDAEDTSSSSSPSTESPDGAGTDSSSDTTDEASDSEMHHMDSGPQHMDTDRSMGGEGSMMDPN